MDICGKSRLPAHRKQDMDMLGDPLPRGAVQRLGTARMTYPNGMAAMAYMSTDRAVVVCGDAIEIVDLANGARIGRFKVSRADVVGMDVISGGRAIALIDNAGDIALWDLEDGREFRRWASGQEKPAHICISRDGERILTIGRNPPTLKEWELSSGRELIAIEGPAESFFLTSYMKVEGGDPAAGDGAFIPTPVQFAMAIYGPGGRTALVGDNAQASLLHYDLASGRLLHQWFPDIYPRRLALSPDGERVLLGSRHRATEWDLATYRLLKAYTGHHGHEASAVAYCRETDQILTGSRDGSLRRWNRVSGELLLRWAPHQRYVTDIAVAPDGKRCLSFGAGSLVESDLQTGSPRLAWDRHQAPILAAAFLPDGQEAVSSSADGTVRLWDITAGKTRRNFAIPQHGLAGYAVSISPDGTRLAVGGYLGIWEFTVADGKLERELKGHRGFIRTLAYSSSGRMLLSGADDGSIRIWGPEDDGPAGVMEGHRGGVLSLAIAPDDSRVISGGRDGTLRLWAIPQCNPLATCAGHAGWVEGVAFAGDRDTALSAGRDGVVRQWDLRASSIIAELAGESWIHALAGSGDGRRAFAGGENGQIVCWDLQSRSVRSILAGHSLPVAGIAVSRDGKRLISASHDTTLLVWDILAAPEM